MTYDWKDKTILIVEDEMLNYKYLEVLLKVTGVNIIWAHDGSEAIEIMKSQNNIALVLMDIQMPDINGYQATETIRKFNNETPILAQTAFVLPDDIQRIKRCGCNDYLPKPIRKEVLYKKIASYIN